MLWFLVRRIWRKYRSWSSHNLYSLCSSYSFFVKIRIVFGLLEIRFLYLEFVVRRWWILRRWMRWMWYKIYLLCFVKFETFEFNAFDWLIKSFSLNFILLEFRRSFRRSPRSRIACGFYILCNRSVKNFGQIRLNRL